LKTSRPVYLNLFKIRLPAPGIVSILHRASGVLLFFLVPVLLWLLGASLAYQSRFNDLQLQFAQSGCLRFFVWITLSALIYHLFAGIRHLLMDFGLGDSLRWGRIGAYIVLVASALFILLMGIWLW
jgi:succinate dehydrogenase / fumarate reductase cytochrome b subunit